MDSLIRDLQEVIAAGHRALNSPDLPVWLRPYISIEIENNQMMISLVKTLKAPKRDVGQSDQDMQVPRERGAKHNENTI